MKDSFLHKKFIFNENIDSEFLFSMYEDDFSYIEEIFKTTLDQLNVVILDIPVSFNNQDVEGLRKIIHKIKPAFGFTGLLNTQKACKDFEDACINIKEADQLTNLYLPFWTVISESMETMQNQYDQLKEFNRQ